MPASKPPLRSMYRHRLPMRLSHWLNAICLFILLLSGLQIFNAHPYLYWGSASDFDSPWLEIDAHRNSDNAVRGHISVMGYDIDTTGTFGVSGDNDVRGFPSWLSWHFFFAWILVINAALFLIWAAISGHLKRLIPTLDDWRGFGRSVIDHIKFRHPTGEAATRYNILQKLAYLIVIFGLGGLIVVTGLCMSPRMNTVMGDVLTFFGGRQSARSLHFLAASGFVLFVFIHLFEVIVTGPWNNLRSMITGRFHYRADASESTEASKTRENFHD